ncbi:hypothetical protein [Paenibacillus tianmuensis]|uniref:hypothetical protein n=1 Tax=Paenibacillus tianmuensis TaxID=624147 RepID=UPI000B89D693|nr:hypothetical protein [Paenibacillus tianmuensis]
MTVISAPTKYVSADPFVPHSMNKLWFSSNFVRHTDPASSLIFSLMLYVYGHHAEKIWFMPREYLLIFMVNLAEN